MNIKSIKIARLMMLVLPLWALFSTGCGDDPASGAGPGTAPTFFDDSLLGTGGILHNGIILNGPTLNGMTLNGMTLNGVSLNGVSFNGMTLNGVSLNGISLNGMTLNGMTLNGMTLNGMTLSGTLFSVSTTGAPISGLAFIGSTWQITVQANGMAQPAPVTLRVDNIYIDPKDPKGDVYLYDISYSLNGSSQWTSLCTDTAGRPMPVVPLRNRWDYQSGARINDPSAVTFACINTALGKCVRLGYRPWASANRCDGKCETVSMADYHQACTRMIRADYCGNGTSYTLDGTLIELYDDLSPAINTNTMHWDMEAQWSADGAECLSDARHAELLVKGRYPVCGSNGRPTHLRSCGNKKMLSDAMLTSTFE